MWRLPGPQALLASLAAALEGGRSVQVLVPAERGPADLLSRLRAELPDQPWNTIRLEDLIRPEMSIEGAVISALGTDADYATATAADLAGASGMGRRVLAVDCGSQPAAAEVAQLGNMISGYAGATRDRPASQRAVFAVRCGGSAAGGLPASDTYVTTRWWWGVLSRIDTQAHLRLLGLDERLTATELASVCELASFDLDAAELLAESWGGDPVQLSDLILPLDCDEASTVRDAVTRLDGPAPDRPPQSLVGLWDRGLVDSWSDRSPCMHLSCVVTGTAQETTRLIWRAQIATLMPMIEVQRERLARWALARRAGVADSWTPINIPELEIGPLVSLIHETPALRTSTAHVQLAKWLKRTRDSLAHRETVDRKWLDRGRVLISEV